MISIYIEMRSPTTLSNAHQAVDEPVIGIACVFQRLDPIDEPFPSFPIKQRDVGNLLGADLTRRYCLSLGLRGGEGDGAGVVGLKKL